jgi:hypothetical protein
MRKYGYIVVEGPHDIEFVYRLLRPFGLKRVRLENDLDPYFEKLIPRKYPPDGDLQKRIPIPLFIQNDYHSLAIRGAIGDSKLIQTVEEYTAVLDKDQITGIGVLLDSDQEIDPRTRYVNIKKDLEDKGFHPADSAGFIADGPPKLGVYILPDHQSQGTLEDLLLGCASIVYPNLLASARTHIENAEKDGSLMKSDLDDLLKPSGRKKAVVGAIASVLRPGKAVQVSLQDNRWLKDETLDIPRVKAFQNFLVNLFEINII